MGDTVRFVGAWLVVGALSVSAPLAAGELGAPEEGTGGSEGVAAESGKQPQPGRTRIFGGLSMVLTDPFQDASNAVGFGLGGQVDLGPWLGVWGLVTYQTKASVKDVAADGPALEYDLGSFGAKVGGTLRLNLAELLGSPKNVAEEIMTALEFGIGPVAGLALYTQDVRDESTRVTLVPCLGLLVEVDIWFARWVALRFAGDFGWSLTEPVAGGRSLMRSEIFLGPSFRF